MEYVKKAIEKARNDRGKRALEGSSEMDAMASSPASDSLNDDDAINIDYSETRSVSLNRHALIENRVIAAFDSDERAEPYRQLRTQVLKKLRDNSWRTLAITSAQQGAGKTLTAVNLAIALAKEVNQTVLLVDMDFKNPSILDVLGLEAEAGLMEYLSSENISIQDILINPGLDRLTILPTLPVKGITSEILSSPGMKSLLDEIVNRYSDRFVIFDLPPLLRDDDALAFLPYADACLLIVEDCVTTPDDLERCGHLLEGTNILGTVFNKARVRTA
ncbi:MAG: CpsD/CapB family tyrosine-protein kinase [Halioglobus sp.]